MCVGHIHFSPSSVMEVDIVSREGFLSGAGALDLRSSLWFGCCQGNVCEQEDEAHISVGAVSAGSAM